MSEIYYMRARVEDDAGLVSECWEKVVDHKIAGYVDDANAQLFDHSPHHQVEYIKWGKFPRRAMIDDPWAEAPAQIF